MENYKSFDEYLDNQSEPHHKIINNLRQLVSELAPELEEKVKWGNGCWVNAKLPVMFVHCKEDYVQFGFYGGSQLNDPNKLLRGGGEYVKHIRIESKSDIDLPKFELLIRQAATLNYKS